MGETRTFRQVQDEALGDDFDASKYRESVKAWVNLALRKIARRVRLQQPLQGTAALNTIAGQGAYALPSDDVRVLSLRDTELAAPLDDIGIDAVDGWEPSSSGRPTVFAVWNRALLLRPVPDGVYALEQRYERDSTGLVADGDLLPLDDAYADLPVYFCRSKLFEAEDDFDAATYWLNRFGAELQEMRADVGRQDRGRSRQVPGMFGDLPDAGPRFRRP